MSTVSISYKSLRDASSDCKKISKKLQSYSDQLQRNVYKKLTTYTSPETQAISDAMSCVSRKTALLSDKQDQYKAYSTQLENLESTCKDVDRNVANRIRSLSADFKLRQGIRSTPVRDSICRFFTSVKNTTWVGRLFNDADFVISSGKELLKDHIRNWYNYRGGRELDRGMAASLVKFGIGLCTLALAVTTAATPLCLAYLISGSIAIFDSIANVHAEAIAYSMRNKDPEHANPALAYRMSKMDKVTDAIRFTATSYHDLNWATALDSAEIIANVVAIVGGFAKGFSSVYHSIKTQGVGITAKNTLLFFKHPISNLKQQYASFSDVKGIISSFKNYLEVLHSVVYIENFSDTTDLFFKKIVVPSLMVVDNKNDEYDFSFQDVFEIMEKKQEISETIQKMDHSLNLPGLPSIPDHLRTPIQTPKPVISVQIPNAIVPTLST